MSTSEQICLGLNRLFPRRRLPGRESPRSYFEADLGEAEEILSSYAPHLRLAGHTLLDGGCGLGGKTLYCAQHGARYVVGLDNDLYHVRYAAKFTNANKTGNLRFMVGSLRALPFPSDSFDVALLNGVVEHIRRPDLQPALVECQRVLKPGGLLCALFPPWTSPSAGHVYDYIHIPWCQLLFSRATIVAALEKLDPAPRFGRLSYIEHFLELNGITISEFKRLATENGYEMVAFRLKMVKGLNFLSRIPVVNKYLTSHVIAVLRKRT